MNDLTLVPQPNVSKVLPRVDQATSYAIAVWKYIRRQGALPNFLSFGLSQQEARTISQQCILESSAQERRDLYKAMRPAPLSKTPLARRRPARLDAPAHYARAVCPDCGAMLQNDGAWRTVEGPAGGSSNLAAVLCPRCHRALMKGLP